MVNPIQMYLKEIVHNTNILGMLTEDTITRTLTSIEQGGVNIIASSGEAIRNEIGETVYTIFSLVQKRYSYMSTVVIEHLIACLNSHSRESFRLNPQLENKIRELIIHQLKAKQIIPLTFKQEDLCTTIIFKAILNANLTMLKPSGISYLKNVYFLSNLSFIKWKEHDIDDNKFEDLYNIIETAIEHAKTQLISNNHLLKACSLHVTEQDEDLLYDGSRNNDEMKIKVALERPGVIGGIINNEVYQGYAPIHWATENSSIEVIKTIVVDGRANVNQLCQQGYTALHLAIYRLCEKQVSSDILIAKVCALLELGANPNKPDTKFDWGYTPLHYAIHYYYKGYYNPETWHVIIEQLLRKNANPTIRTHHNKSVIELAKCCGFTDIETTLQLVVSRGLLNISDTLSNRLRGQILFPSVAIAIEDLQNSNIYDNDTVNQFISSSNVRINISNLIEEVGSPIFSSSSSTENQNSNRQVILTKGESDILFPNSENKEQWLNATNFMTQYLSLSENQRLELRSNFEGMQGYFSEVRESINRLKVSEEITEELFEKMNNYLNLVLMEEQSMQLSPRPGRR